MNITISEMLLFYSLLKDERASLNTKIGNQKIYADNLDETMRRIQSSWDRAHRKQTKSIHENITRRYKPLEKQP